MFKAASGAVYRGVKAQAGSPRSILTGQLVSAGAIADYLAGNAVGTLNASAVTNLPQFTAPSLTASGGAQPIILSFSGQKYAWFPAVDGNYLSSAYSAASVPSADFDLIFHFDLNTYTYAPGADKILFLNGANTSESTRNIYVLQKSSGQIYVDVPTGSTVRGFISSVALSFGAGGGYLKISFTANDGAGNSLVNFSTSTDGVTYSALGTQQSVATIGAKNANTTGIFIAASQTGTLTVPGKLFSVTVTNGIGGSPVMQFSASDWPETTTNGATAVSSTTGETWTLANTGTLLAQIVGSPQLLGDGVAHIMQMTATIPAPYFAIEVANYISWTSANVMADGKTSNSFATQQITGTPQVKMWDGTTLTASISPTLNTYNIISIGQSAAGAATIQLNGGTAATGTLNATALAGWTEFANGAGTKFGNKQVKERIIFPVIPSAGQLANINALLKAIHGTP